MYCLFSCYPLIKKIVHCVATIFSAILNKLWCHVILFFRRNINMLGDVTFPQLCIYNESLGSIRIKRLYNIHTNFSEKIQASRVA